MAIRYISLAKVSDGCERVKKGVIMEKFIMDRMRAMGNLSLEAKEEILVNLLIEKYGISAEDAKKTIGNVEEKLREMAQGEVEKLSNSIITF